MKIDKSKLIEGKNGAKYLNFTVISNKNGPDQYGKTHMITQDVSQEEREAGKRGAILGNGKRWEQNGARQQSRPAQKQQSFDDSDMAF